MVRAKYKCTEVIKRESYNNSNKKFVYTAKFYVVTSGSEENNKFFEYTPSGNIDIGTYKEDVFEVGKEYYVDFTKIGE